ncbi:hypothetical protein NHQ30_005998 [Ciborinia camelliae]|nr:hypothetical protein NHQ30_005998 [Ciborinia camelliae]
MARKRFFSFSCFKSEDKEQANTRVISRAKKRFRRISQAVAHYIRINSTSKSRTNIESTNIQESQNGQATLLSLPRELRDIIYDYVYPFDTYVAPFCDKREGKFQSIYCTLCPFPFVFPEAFSPSLLRVHPIIYQEAKELFWNRARFLFPNLKCVVDTLDLMGPIPGRLITHIELHTRFSCFDATIEDPLFPHLLSMINSRARHGQLQSVILLVEPSYIARSFERFLERRTADGQYINFQDRLRLIANAQTWRCHRGMRILDCASYDGLLKIIREIYHTMTMERLMDAIEELYWAWGGTLYFGDTVVWENGHHVYKPPQNLNMNPGLGHFKCDDDG